jgi:hypothetical protein
MTLGMVITLVVLGYPQPSPKPGPAGGGGVDLPLSLQCLGMDAVHRLDGSGLRLAVPPRYLWGMRQGLA